MHLMAASVAVFLSIHPAQRALLFPAIDQAGPRVIIARAGIRGGKTEVGAIATVLQAINDPTAEDECHAVTSPTFAMSKLGPEPKLKKVLFDRSIFPVSPLVRHAKSERAFYVKNRLGGLSRIRIFSGEDPDRWRGDKWRSWWPDEGAYLTSDARDVGLGRLADTNGRMLVTTTPDGRNWLSDFSDECTVEETRYVKRTDAAGAKLRMPYTVRRSPDSRILEVRWSSLANPFVPLEGFEELKARYDDDTYRQEVLAEYVAKSGRVYREFEREKHVVELPVSAGRVFIGADFNVERMAWCFAQETSVTGTGKPGLHVFAEQEIRDADTRKSALLAKRLLQERGVDLARVTIHPDASGKRRQTAGSDTSRSDLHILRELGFRVEAGTSNPPIKDRVNCVNGLFAHGRLTVSPRCPMTIEALERQPWDPNTDPVVPLKDGILDNRADALGYVAWARYPLRRATIIGKAAA